METTSDIVRREKRRVSLITLIVSVVIAAIGSFVIGTRSTQIWALATGHKSSQLDLSSLQQVYDVLESKYDGQLDVNKLIDGAKHGLVNAAGDPYTTYFSAKEAEEFQSDLEGKFEGIGAELGKRDNKLVVVSTLDDSPAKAAGLLANDVIVKVNSEDATSWSIDQAVSKIRGEKGTTVKLSIVRGDELKDISITRDTINNPSVKSEITPDNIGILRISRFGQSDTVSLSKQAAEQFKSAGVKGVVVDLRGNGGGYLDAAVDIAGIWLNNKTVVTERTGGKITDTKRTGNEAMLNGVPTIVLVDGGSASASEILAGALKDNGAATLTGEKTFGKGSVQIIENLPDGAGLKVTVAKWYTPNGKNINKEGIAPDTTVSITSDDILGGRDPQKDKALEQLRAAR